MPATATKATVKSAGSGVACPVRATEPANDAAETAMPSVNAIC